MNTLKDIIASLISTYNKMDDDWKGAMKITPIVIGILCFVASGIWQLNHEWTFISIFPKAIGAAFFAFIMIHCLLGFFFVFYALAALLIRKISVWSASRPLSKEI